MSRLLLSLGLASSMLVSTLGAQARPRHEEFTLGNGLRVILLEDHSTPVVTVDIWYRVGSRNEQLGRTGLAHVFERLMFRGSEHVADGQHYQLVDAVGGETTANTTEDRAAFAETLPSNQLALGLWLEADRMRSLKITDQAFASQRDAVKQERQMRVDNQPYGSAFLDGVTTAFDSAACFPYAHSAMGSLDDLEGTELSDVQAFFQLHYTPSRATLTVVGDFEPAEARRLIQSYFADIPRGAPVPDVSCGVNYAVGEKTRQWQDPLANLPAVIVAYRTPAHADPDSRALQLLALVIGQGEGSRLQRALVREEHVAVQAASGLDSRAGPGILFAYAIAAQGVNVEDAKKALSAQVARAGIDVTQAELDRARNQFRATSLMGRQTTAQMAEELQHFALFHSSANEIATDLDQYAAVTLADLRRVAARYLTPPNSTTLVVLPIGGGGAAPPGDHPHQEDQ